MTVGSYPASRTMTCQRCKHEIRTGETAWFTKGKRGYWCQSCQDDWIASNKGGQYQTETTTTTTAETPTAEAARQSSIAKAHEENMISERQTRDVLAMIVTALDQHRQAIVDLRLHLEGKR